MLTSFFPFLVLHKRKEMCEHESLLRRAYVGGGSTKGAAWRESHERQTHLLAVNDDGELVRGLSAGFVDDLCD